MTDITIFLSPEVLLVLISMFILLVGIEKQDAIIGVLCCYSVTFILLFALATELLPNINGEVVFLIMFISGAIGTYKVYLANRERGN